MILSRKNTNELKKRIKCFKYTYLIINFLFHVFELFGKHQSWINIFKFVLKHQQGVHVLVY